MVSVTYIFSKMQVNIYIDGVLNSSTDNVPAPDANNTVDVYMGSFAPLLFFGGDLEGKFDDIRIYNRALSANEILALSALSD
jgi:hypothetical protein